MIYPAVMRACSRMVLGKAVRAIIADGRLILLMPNLNSKMGIARARC